MLTEALLSAVAEAVFGWVIQTGWLTECAPSWA